MHPARREIRCPRRARPVRAGLRTGGEVPGEGRGRRCVDARRPVAGRTRLVGWVEPQAKPINDGGPGRWVSLRSTHPTADAGREGYCESLSFEVKYAHHTNTDNRLDGK